MLRFDADGRLARVNGAAESVLAAQGRPAEPGSTLIDCLGCDELAARALLETRDPVLVLGGEYAARARPSRASSGRVITITPRSEPGPEEAAPSSEDPAPSSEEAAPSSEEAAPSSEEAAPSSEEAAPSSEEAAPSSEEAAPSSEEAAPEPSVPYGALVELAPTPIMLCDRELVVRYANAASRELLDELRAQLAVEPAAVVGASIDVFRLPEEARARIEAPAELPFETEIELSEDRLALLVSAVFDEEGAYYGPMLTWRKVTEQRRLEAEERAAEVRTEALERTLRASREDLQSRVELILESVQAAAKGDLTVPIPVGGSDALGQLGEALTACFDNLRRSLRDIAAEAASLGRASSQLGKSASSLNEASGQTSSRAEGAAARSGAIGRSAQDVADMAEGLTRTIRRLVEEARRSASVSDEAVQQTATTREVIGGLDTSSSEIGVVVRLIGEVAEQTSLLALNASIEAARAGDAGKGFAVVASQIKQLSLQSTTATHEISTKIEGIRRDTDRSSTAIEGIGQTIGRLADFTGSLAESVDAETRDLGGIAKSAAEAAVGSREIASSLGELSEVAREALRRADATQVASRQLHETASRLEGLVGSFRL